MDVSLRGWILGAPFRSFRCDVVPLLFLDGLFFRASPPFHCDQAAPLFPLASPIIPLAYMCLPTIPIPHNGVSVSHCVVGRPHINHTTDRTRFSLPAFHLSIYVSLSLQLTLVIDRTYNDLIVFSVCSNSFALIYYTQCSDDHFTQEPVSLLQILS